LQDNRRKLIFLLPALLSLVVPNVYAGGPRLDWPEDSKDCWVEGYDAGFAQKYDKDRADQCAQENDEYNRSWGYALAEMMLYLVEMEMI
jgi:hypothetical protein